MNRLLLLTLIAVVALPAGLAIASTSHAGWPNFDVLKMHKRDQNGRLTGHAGKHNELLGGHGNDTLLGRDKADVLWGDYKPGGQPARQVDRIYGRGGKDFIYASHGRNIIFAGAGNDTIHAHYGHGEIHCGSGRDRLFISHRSRRHYKISGCEKVSYKTNGH